jgi:type IV fimbrial biogenesis protein FimT
VKLCSKNFQYRSGLCAFSVRRLNQQGLTLVELMVVIAIAAVLAALAAPSFFSLMERWRVRQASEALQSTLYFARSEAIKNGGRVVVQKLTSADNAACTGGSNAADWDCGWLVCNDNNDNGACDVTETVLQRYDAPPGVQVTRTSGAATIRLDRWGAVRGPFLGFSLVPQGRSTADASAIGVCMSAGGRIRAIPPSQIPCAD